MFIRLAKDILDYKVILREYKRLLYLLFYKLLSCYKVFEVFIVYINLKFLNTL